MFSRAREAPRRPARSASRARREGAARRCGRSVESLEPLGQSGALDEVSARVEDEGSNAGRSEPRGAGAPRTSAPDGGRASQQRSKREGRARYGSPLGISMRVGPVMPLLAPPQPVKLTARSPIISTDQSARRIGRVPLVRRPTGDARIFKAWLEVSIHGATDVPTRPSRAPLDSPENSIGCITPWAGGV